MNSVYRRYEALQETRRASRRLSDSDRCSADPNLPTISVTSFPARIERLHLTIATMLRQSVKPREILVTLAASEFPHGRLPRSLEQLRDRGITIDWVGENSRSYKKLIPAILRYPDRTVVTVDDDVLYPDGWLEILVRESLRLPGEILGMRGTAISGSATPVGVDPYVSWRPAHPGTRSGRTFLTGMGGILYPPRALAPAVTDLALAQKLCPTADDIWFKAMAMLGGSRVRRAIGTPAEYHTSVGTQKVSLRAVNVDTGANDRQFAAVLNHFDLWSELDG